MADNGRFVEKEHIIYDKKNAIEWLRCSVGQTWNGSTCTGKVINLTMDESEQLHPEQSTTAIISLHSKSKYFSA